MDLVVNPPFPGPVKVRLANPVGTLTLFGSLALAAVGVGFGAAGIRHRRQHGRLRCGHEDTTPGSHHVGVPLDYQGDWWAERGQRLYWKARRGGETTASGIARAIIASEIGPESFCMSQFPPNADTYEVNKTLWNGMVAKVQQEMAAERASA